MTAKIHALIVEDLDFWQDTLREVLSDAGYQISVAASYTTALDALGQHKFGLAVIDPVLEDTNRHNRDGLRVLRHILDKSPATRTIVTTSSDPKRIRSEVAEISTNIPILWKDEWDDKRFLGVVQGLFAKSTPNTKKGSAKARPARVLIVEDESEWQNIVQELLTDEGHIHQTASSYEKALALLSQGPFNVIFLDMMLHEFDLPVREGNGWRLLNHLVEQHPRTKIIVLSGRATAGDAVRLMRDYPITTFIDKGEQDVEKQILDAVHLAMKTPTLRIQTFGQFKIWRNGQLVDSWEQPEAKTVIKLLLTRRAAGAKTISPGELVKLLWPDEKPHLGRKKLLPLLNSARRALEPDIEPNDSSFILRSSTGYYFDLGANVTWDVRAFRKLIRDAGAKQRKGQQEKATASFESARKLYVDDYLTEDGNIPWAALQRQALQAEYRDALSRQAEAYASLGRYPDAIRAGEAALGVDPLLESIYRQLMRYHACAGNKTQALKVYRNCEKLFGELLGEELTPQTKHLLESINNNVDLDCQSS
jgi:two-component SAPR family response regulator